MRWRRYFELEKKLGELQALLLGFACGRAEGLSVLSRLRALRGLGLALHLALGLLGSARKSRHPGHARHPAPAAHLLHHLLGLGEPVDQVVDVGDLNPRLGQLNGKALEGQALLTEIG